MNPKLPSSILVSVYLASGLSLAFAFIGSLGEHGTENLLYESLVFFFVAFISMVITLEWLVFRRLKSLNILNQREIKKLKDLEAYRREFLGEVSHELKTPIFAVQGFIHTLMDGAIEDDRVKMKFLKKAMKNADRLSSLVEDLLIITQAESGEMEMKIRRFGIHELVSDVLDSLEYKFTKKQRNISYRLNANGNEEVQILADRERIQQVLINLIDNAIKYGDLEGEVIIDLRQEGGKVYVSIQDDGPGIGEEHLDKIFRRFYRVDKSRSREKGGTGLGLAICKHLLKLHGEQITVDSTLGKGTTFTFSLKVAE
ncbi:HAMP domain-containing sensor histidine kinase [Pontibacter sp. G13]|uniref:sensor histidine kinase n=1 Tax=Pontibacter sp. G13 TaxID=3074898 RepID=UPI00288A9F54|nr:HAMP domain-containing sensor histidine kinase [Pontibacter sp. G13]WNJ21191.1 HAMP domain-containing sensor histidine kinase [Pontibacter sp. G13]